MSDKELRVRCLELATLITPKGWPYQETLEAAQKLYEWANGSKNP